MYICSLSFPPSGRGVDALLWRREGSACCRGGGRRQSSRAAGTERGLLRAVCLPPPPLLCWPCGFRASTAKSGTCAILADDPARARNEGGHGRLVVAVLLAVRALAAGGARASGLSTCSVQAMETMDSDVPPSGTRPHRLSTGPGSRMPYRVVVAAAAAR